MLGQSLVVADHIGELLRNLDRLMFVVVHPEDLIAVSLVRKQKLQRGFPQEFIYLSFTLGAAQSMDR